MGISLDPDWLTPGDAARGDGCRAVWLATITLAIQDSLLPLGTRRDSAGLNVGRVRDWLSTPSRDRALVCALANVDEGWLETRALPVLVERWQVADAGPVQPRRRQGDAESRQSAIRPRGASRADSLRPGSALLGQRSRPGKVLEQAGPRAQGRDRGRALVGSCRVTPALRRDGLLEAADQIPAPGGGGFIPARSQNSALEVRRPRLMASRISRAATRCCGLVRKIVVVMSSWPNRAR
jgi:hypothetical protein